MMNFTQTIKLESLQVFGIVAIQLMVTVGFACVCLFVPEVKVRAAAAAVLGQQQQQQQQLVSSAAATGQLQ
jgi:hypothetical protein